MKHTFKHLGAAALALTLLLSGCSQTAGQTSDQETGEGAGSPDAQALSLVTDIPSAPPEGWDGSMELPEDMQLPEDWGGELPEATRTLDNHIKQVRHAIAPYSDLIVTLRGIGYRFEKE